MQMEFREKAALEDLVTEMGQVAAGGGWVADPAEVTGRNIMVEAERNIRVLPGWPMVGDLFGGRYQILAIVGCGGMGAVYRAMDRELEEEVALKVLNEK